MIAVSTLGAAAIGATLALFFVANARLKAANTASARSATVSAAAFDVRAAVVAIDQALQGVVEQYDATSLAQWRYAASSRACCSARETDSSTAVIGAPAR